MDGLPIWYDTWLTRNPDDEEDELAIRYARQQRLCERADDERDRRRDERATGL